MSYMMKKSLADEMRKSLDPKMLYFKKKILDHLKKLGKKEDKEKTSLKKSLIIAETMAKGGAGLPVGTIRVWKGKKYIKVAPGKWKPKYDSNTRGAKMAIAALKKKLEACETSEEMLQLVLANRSRFSDEVTGRPLPFVQELADYVSSLNDKKEKKPKKNKEVKATVTDSQTNERVISEYLGDKKGVGDRIKEGNKETIWGNDYSKKHKLEFKMNVMGAILGKPQMDQELFDELSQYSLGADSHKLAPKYGLRGEEFFALVNKVKENRVTIVNAEEKKKEGNKYSLDDVKQILQSKNKDEFIKMMNLQPELPSGKKYYVDRIAQNIIDTYGKDSKEFDYLLENIEPYNRTGDTFNLYAIKDGKVKEFEQIEKDGIAFFKRNSKENIEFIKNGKIENINGDTFFITKPIPAPSEYFKWNFMNNEEISGRFKVLKDKNGLYIKDHNNNKTYLPDTKEIEAEKKEDGHYWIQDSKGDRLTNIDAKKRIKQNLSQINSFNELMEGRSKADNLRMESAKRSLEYDNNRLMERLNSEDREEMKTEFDKYQKPEKENPVNTKLSADNIKALDSLPEKFADEKKLILKYPSEVEIDGEKKFAYTNGQFLVVTHDIPADGVKTKQSEKIEGNYPNVERVIPEEFKDNSAPKVDINIDQVMKDLPKVDFSKKAFNDDSHKQFMKIGNFWYDAKQIQATYDMLKGDNAEVLESKNTYSNGRFGRLCIKTDKGYSVIVSSSNDYAEYYKKQAIYNSDEGSMSASAKAEYESRKKTGLSDTYVNNAVDFGYQIDSKGFIHGEDKDITFKGKGENTEFYYKGIPTGIKNRSSYMYGTKESIQTRIDAVKEQIGKNIEWYKEGKKNPAIKPANYDATFSNMTDKDLTDIYKWWSNPKNIEEAIYKNSYKTKVPGLGSYGNDARKIGAVEDRVMDMLPDIEKEIARRGITVKKSIDGELIFESSL